LSLSNINAEPTTKTPEVSWSSLDWAVLDRLRECFLARSATGADYWRTPADIANYDFTYGERIGWKWDAVLRELRLRGWFPPPHSVLLDWGCGSGVAGRRILDFFGAHQFAALQLFDRSTLAMEFATAAARRRYPELSIECAGRGVPTSGRGTVLVASHVLNELDEAATRSLRQALDGADAVLWVEPGTHADSRALIAMRDSLMDQFVVVAPCTHQAPCGLQAAVNERHWCHQFATPPAGVMGDGDWVRFAQRAGIDLRSAPYSFLVLERRGLREPIPGRLPEGWARFLGGSRVYKGYARVLGCRADGVREWMLQKRDAPSLFKAVKSGRAGPLHRWTAAGNHIVDAESMDEMKGDRPGPE
jgi:hypothetical protein